MGKYVASIIIALAFLVVVPTYAQQDAAIEVQANTVQLDFPAGITFRLEAQSSAAAITQVQLLYGATRSNALTIVELPRPGDSAVKVEHFLDTQVSYYPPGTDITYRWLIRDALGNEYETEAQQIVYHDQRFAWQEQTVQEVTIYWYDGGATFGQALAGVVDRTLTNLRSELGADLSHPVRIYIYPTQFDMYSALPPNAAEWIGGQANPALGTIVAAIAPSDTVEIQRMIPHEISHQVLHQVVDNPYGNAPLWLDEGLAVHHQEVRDTDYDQQIVQAAEENRLIPLEALASSFPADPDQARLSYAQSRAMVEYILDTYGAAKIQALVAAIADTQPIEAAVTTTFGMTLDELDAEWRATLPSPRLPPPDFAGPQVAPDDRFSEIPVVPPPSNLPLPPAQDEPPPPAWELWLISLPPWAPITMAALACTTGFVILGFVILVSLRLIGVDKRD